MHAEALEAVRRMVNVSGYINASLPDGRRSKLVGERLGLDIGGADVNGSARELIPFVGGWYGLDIAEGDDVDLVVDATDATAMSAYHELFDVVLCTEVLEHVADWRGVLDNAWTVLAPGGFAFFTFAATDTRTWARRPHGARGELDVPNGEHYANIVVDEFAAHLVKLVDRDIEISQQLVELTVDDDQGRRAEMTVNPNPGDVYAWFRK
jgi:SAM-dependent methyltransferase